MSVFVVAKERRGASTSFSKYWEKVACDAASLMVQATMDFHALSKVLDSRSAVIHACHCTKIKPHTQALLLNLVAASWTAFSDRKHTHPQSSGVPSSM